MRHGKKFNHLGRTSSHRKAMMSNMASSLIVHKRIATTLAKAKALRKYVEPLITKSKVDSTHSRRVVFSYLQDKTSAQMLFDEVATKVGDRPGGYTRIIKMGNRLGDDAEMCLIELVDYNEVFTTEKAAKRTRRSRRGSKKGDSDTDTQAKTSAPAQQKQQEEDQLEARQEEPQTEETQAAAPSEQEVEASSAETETEKRTEETSQDESDQKDSAQDESSEDDQKKEDQ